MEKDKKRKFMRKRVNIGYLNIDKNVKNFK